MKNLLLKRIWKASVFVILTAPMFQIQAAKRQMEYLDRGLTAVKVSNGVFVNWRYLGTDSSDIAFNLYRDGVKVNTSPISTATNIVDPQGTLLSTYAVHPIWNGQEQEPCKIASVWTNQYMTLQMNKPDDAVDVDGVSYTYTPNDCSVADLDGDGQYEVIVKWDPSNSQDNSLAGYTGHVYLDAYKLDGTMLWRIDLGKNIRAGAHYTQFMVYDLDGDGKAEIACKTAPGTIDGVGNFVLMGSDNPNVDYRNISTATTGSNRKGFVLKGPEYLTVFNGETGAERHTIAYKPARGTVESWGDNYGNRVDRFLAAIAYLDGVHPSLVMCRGYYTRSTLAAYDFKEGKLVERWFHDSPAAGQGAYGEGNHSLAVGDVDGDGFDEIIYGACVINHDGKLLYRTGFGHGDALHLSDMNPDIPGLEIFSPHENKTSLYGFEMHSAHNGKVMMGEFTGTDVGRGLAADICPNNRGFEMWTTASNQVYNCKGDVISTRRPTVNFRVYWDGDLQDEILDGTKIDKWSSTAITRLITFSNFSNAKEINSTKANPCLSADIFGDWREEVIYFNQSDPSQLLIFTTTIPTQYRMFTLMHDPIYRLSVAWQNVAYNQPPHLGIYIGDGLENISQPDIYTVKYGDISSDIEFTTASKEAKMEVYPNIVRDNAYIYLRASESDQGIVTITNILGKQQKSLPILIEEGSNKIDIPMNDISSGIYLLNLTYKGGSSTIRIIKK